MKNQQRVEEIRQVKETFGEIPEKVGQLMSKQGGETGLKETVKAVVDLHEPLINRSGPPPGIIPRFYEARREERRQGWELAMCFAKASVENRGKKSLDQLIIERRGQMLREGFWAQFELKPK